MSAVVVQMLPPRRGRRPIDDERNCIRMIPRHVKVSGMTGLYALGFTDGRVKFGKAFRPRARLLAYWNQMGGAIQWVHYFGMIVDGPWRAGRCPAEDDACARAALVGSRINRSEYFTGLTKAQALSIGRAARADDLVRRSNKKAKVA